MLFNRDGNIEENVDVTVEDMQSIVEGMLSELSDEELLEAFADEADIETAVEEGLLTEAAVKKYVVRLDRGRRMNQATKVAVFKIAREKKDPKMKKLMMVWRMERQLEEELLKKYRSEATRRAKKTVDTAMKSKSNVIAKAASKAKSQFNGDKAVKGNKPFDKKK